MTSRSIIGTVLALGISATLGRPAPSAQRSSNDAPPVPYEDVGACPFEGCIYREWIATAAVTVRRDRRASSPVVFSVKKDERVTALTGVVVTIKAGRVQFRGPVELSSTSGSLHITSGQTLYLLTYRGEGFTKTWFEGRLYDNVDGSTFLNAFCDDDPSRCVGKVVENPRSVWWVQVKNAKGQVGWSSQADKFDNKDDLADASSFTGIADLSRRK